MSCEYPTTHLIRHQENLRVNMRPTAESATRILNDQNLTPSMLGRATKRPAPIAGDVLRAYDAFSNAGSSVNGAPGFLIGIYRVMHRETP